MTHYRANPGLSASTYRRGSLLVTFALLVSLLAPPATAEPTPTPAASAKQAEESTTLKLVATAKTEAKRAGREVEIPSLHTENMTTVAMPNGKTVKTYVSLTPVRTKRNGQWQAIDTTLVLEDGIVRPKVTKLDLALSNGGDGPLLKATGESLGTAKDGKPGEIVVAAPAKLPAPQLSGSTATYHSAYGRNIDLVVTVTPDGYQQQIVIRERPDRRVTLPVHIDPPTGMKVAKAKDGKPAAMAGEKEVADLSVLPVLDAKELERPGTGKSGLAKTAITGSGDKTVLVLTPDSAFLADPAVTYPVTVAATNSTPWHGAGAPTDTFIANGGSYTNGSYAANMNAIFAGRRDGYNYRSYLKYNLAGAPFIGQQIFDANIILWNYLSSACGEVGGISLHRIAADWAVNTLSWSSQPQAVADGHVVNPYGKDQNCSDWMAEGELWYSIEEITQAWADGTPNHGVMIRSVAESGGNNWRQYLSGNYPETSPDGSHHPYFFVEYETPVPPRRETVVMSSREPLTAIPEYEQALSRSLYLPENDTVEAVSAELVAGNAKRRDGEGSLIGNDRLSPDIASPDDGGDTEVPGDEDTLPPRVLSTDPAADAVEVPLNATPRVTFTEPVGGGELSVKNAQGAEVQGDFQFDSTGKVTTFVPAQPLRPGVKYTVTVASAVDASDNVMEPYTWSFTTVRQTAGHWTFDEGTGPTAADSSGHNRDATLNETASWTTGKTGNALTNTPTGTPTSTPTPTPTVTPTPTSEFPAPLRRQGSASALLLAAPTLSALSLTPSQTINGALTAFSLTPVLAATVTDADGRISTVDFQIRYTTGDTSNVWAGQAANVASGTQATGTVSGGTLSHGSSYVWRARATAGSDVSAWSAWQSFQVDAAPVVDQFQVTPSQTIAGTVTTSSLTPTLKARPTAKLGGASTVDFQIRYSTSDNSNVWSGQVTGVASGTQTSSTVVAATLQDGLSYVWRARATAEGVVGSWSSWQVLKVDVPEAVVDQLQVTPAQLVGSTVTTSTLTPTLHARATDPLGGPSTVDFQIRHSTSDNSNVWSGQATNVTSGSEASKSVTAGVLSNGTGYVWRARASTPGSTPSWSPWQTFAVDAAPVVDQFQVTPSQVIGETVTTSSLTPTLRARPTAKLGGASTVDFEVRYSMSDSSNVWTGQVTGVASGTQTSRTVAAATLQDGSSYVWRARATAEGVVGPWSSWQTLKVDVPEAVVDQFQVTPSQVIGGTVTTTSLTPVLAARVTDQLGGASTMDFQIRYSTSDNTNLWSGQVSGVTSGAIASRAVASATLSDGSSYVWRVKGTTPGSTPSWSPWQTLKVDVPEAVVDQFQVTPSETVGGTVTTSSLTPELAVRAVDPLGGASTVAFEVRYSTSDNTNAWAGQVSGVGSGSQASKSVTAGVLSNGSGYVWRARASTPGSTPSWSPWQTLRVDLFDPATDPAVTQPQVVPSQVEGGTTVTSSATPELRALINHPQGAASRVEFEVEHDPAAPQGQGTGQIWATALAGVASGSPGVVTVPAGKLGDGWAVRWRVRALAGGSTSTWSAWQQLTVLIPKPGVEQLQVTPSSVVNDKTVTTVLTPSLHAQVTYAPGGTLRAEFEVEHDPAAPQGQGTGQIWAGAVDHVPAGTRATAAVPVGELTDGWLVRWRVRSAVGSTTSPWSPWQQLLVDQPDSAPDVQELQVTPSGQAGGRTVTPTVTPQLRATVLDPRGEPVRAEFEVEHDPAAPQGQGTGQIWAGGLDGVAVGSQAALAVPTGTLTDGWAVRWRARAVSASAASPWSAWQQLDIEVPKPGVAQLQVIPSQVVNGTTVTTVLTPSLHAQVTYAPGGTLRAEFEVEHDPAAPQGQGAGQIWATAVDGGAGTQVGVAVPAGALIDGWTVRWRVRALAGELASAWSSWQRLVVDRPDSAPAAGDLQVTPSKTVNGRLVTGTETPQLRATLTDPRGDALSAEFEIEHDPAAPQGQGSGQVWTGSVSGVQPDAQAALTVPAGELADGWLVRWRVRAVSATAASPWSGWQALKVDVVHPGEEPLARTSGPVIRTDESFTVAAWLRWNEAGGDYSVVEQKGVHQAPFKLGSDPEHGLVFTFTGTDAAGTTVEGALSGVRPSAGAWFHLAGAYDAAAGTASLYLDGVLIKSSPVSFPAWNADAAMELGSRMKGALDEVQVYQRTLDAAQVLALAVGPTAQPARVQKTPAQKASVAAATGGFDYQHLSLEDCLVSSSETDYEDYNARIREQPYTSCWSSYLYMQDYEDDSSSGRMEKSFCKSKVKNIVARWLCSAGEELIDDDYALRFRATWVIHSYLGGPTGTPVVNGGTSGIKPNDMKMFIQLDEFAVVDDDGRVVVPGSQLQGLSVSTQLETRQPPFSDGSCESDATYKTKDISEWRTRPYDVFNVKADVDPASVFICTMAPQVVFHWNGWDVLRLRIWSDKALDSDGKVVGIRRHGDGKPHLRSWIPNYRCDNLPFGAQNPAVDDRLGGCINTRSKRVFVMSKTDNSDYIEVIQHIEEALNPVNRQTFPPLRPGDAWVNPNYPPTRTPQGNEQNKFIYGNWAAPRFDANGDDAQGKPLTRGIPGVTSGINRLHFSGIPLYMDMGTPNEMQWLIPPNREQHRRSINYCKYYMPEKYPEPFRADKLPLGGTNSCDEYPFASTMQGASYAQGHYSVKAVDAIQNTKQGRRLETFYADFRVGEGNPFWVLIAP
ncbi:Ig-like domain-containing protein [Rhizohabitans arisaemae]|uniref:Ig-like domain-containing protein n=1 Tax=Rhizohabitans arisaemae TaxID=2720610 RepID=UPI0024B19F73|nr:LamG-like jellyroll fold domain-containing protein [Rhizohabitans arisaemae]